MPLDALSAAERLLGLFTRLRKLSLGQLPLHDVGVTMAQLVLLDWIAASPGCGISEIANGLDLTAPTVSVGARRLERAGLLERNPDPDDGRAIRLTLTARGRELHQQARAFRLGKMDRLLAGLTTEEADQLAHLLGKAIADAEGADPGNRDL